MIVVRLSGGLGNQMFQFAAAFALAHRKRCAIYLDCSSYAHDEFGRHYGLRIFNAHGRILGASFRLALRFLCKMHPLVGMPSIIVDREQGYDCRIFNEPGPLVLSGYWQSYKYFEDVEAPLRSQFTFSTEPPQEVILWLERIRNTPNATALHIRRKDYITHPEASRVHGCCDGAYYQRAIAHLVSTCRSPSIFIFSDDPEWARLNIYVDVPCVVVSSRGGWADAEDLRLMTACKHFIIANSSFSWWAAWLGSQEGKRVIAPALWYAGRQEPPDLIPQEWLRL